MDVVIVSRCHHKLPGNASEMHHPGTKSMARHIPCISQTASSRSETRCHFNNVHSSRAVALTDKWRHCGRMSPLLLHPYVGCWPRPVRVGQWSMSDHPVGSIDDSALWALRVRSCCCIRYDLQKKNVTTVEASRSADRNSTDGSFRHNLPWNKL